jgi:hypothetical protein
MAAQAVDEEAGQRLAQRQRALAAARDRGRDGGHHGGVGLADRRQFDQRDDVGRLEIVQRRVALGMGQAVGQVLHRQAGGVGDQDRPAAIGRLDPGVEGDLRPHLLDDRLDDEVAARPAGRPGSRPSGTPVASRASG